MSAAVRVRGALAPDELAALLAALARPVEPAGPSEYERWRAGRLAALRQVPRRR